MVNMAFARKSGGREGKVISRIDPLHLEGGQHNQPVIILHSTDLQPHFGCSAMAKPNQAWWREVHLVDLMNDLYHCCYGHFVHETVEQAWREEIKWCPQNGLPCSPHCWGSPLPWVLCGDCIHKGSVFSHSVPFNEVQPHSSSPDFLVTNLPVWFILTPWLTSLCHYHESVQECTYISFLAK